MQALELQFPGVRFHESGGRIRAVYGAPMIAGTSGLSAQAGAQSWLAQFGRVFGEESLELELHSVIPGRTAKTTVSFTQRMGGVPVQNSMVTLVVSHNPAPRVAFAGARIATRPPGGLAPALISAAQATLIARAHPVAAGLMHWVTPREVAYWADAPGTEPVARRVWSVEGSSTVPHRVWTFLVDAQTGLVIHNHSSLVHYDVTGTVSAYVTPFQRPYPWPCTATCPNPPTLLVPLPNLRVRALDPVTGNPLFSTYTSANGTYSLPVLNGTQVTLEAALVGAYWRVHDAFQPAGHPTLHPPATPETLGTPAQPVVVNNTVWHPTFNSTGTEHRTAHTNIFYEMERTWSYFTTRLDASGCDCYPGLYSTCTAFANWISYPGGPQFPACNGWWSGDYIGFSPASGAASCDPEACPNVAYGSWVPHEYGHFISHLNRNINPQQQPVHEGWSEGYADSVSHLLHDESLWGRDWEGCALANRNPLLPRRVYPECSGDRYERGMVLSGIWLDILLFMREDYGTASGLELTRQLHVDWSMFMMGGSYELCGLPPPGRSQSAHVLALLEVLIADDDDGDLTNGTPHQGPICAGFAAHDICDSSYCLCGSRPAAALCPGDCNNDGLVSIADIDCFHREYSVGSLLIDCTQDGRVNLSDVACFQRALAIGCPAEK